MLMAAERPALAQAVDAYEQVGGNIVVVEPAPEGETHKYGIVALDARRTAASNRMTGMVEKPPPGTEPSNLFISGRYILQPEIFQILETQERGAGGEIQLTDAMATLMQTPGLPRPGIRGDHLRLRRQDRPAARQRRLRAAPAPTSPTRPARRSRRCSRAGGARRRLLDLRLRLSPPARSRAGCSAGLARGRRPSAGRPTGRGWTLEGVDAGPGRTTRDAWRRAVRDADAILVTAPPDAAGLPGPAAPWSRRWPRPGPSPTGSAISRPPASMATGTAAG